MAVARAVCGVAIGSTFALPGHCPGKDRRGPARREERAAPGRQQRPGTEVVVNIHRWVLSLVSLLLIGTWQCGPRMFEASDSRWRTAYRERAGHISEQDLAVRLPRALARHGFMIETTEQRFRNYHFETQWRYRKPFADEIERGAVEARTRLRLRANWIGQWYELNVEAENEILPHGGAWVREATTRMFESYARDIVNTIRHQAMGRN